MPGRRIESETEERNDRVSHVPDTVADAASRESQIRDEELYRMAAFRIHETANRIATLANNTRDQALRSELVTIYERLLEEERALLARGSQGDR